MKNELRLEAQKRMDRAFKAEQRDNHDGTVSNFETGVADVLNWVADHV
ncbi:hypothetical protein ABNZ43_04370 [Weissella sp. GP1]|nr:hypothetical protein [Weissella confusa]MBF7058593.1 hypothetical protein [Weissella confusa]MBJ7630991.1 hypothetical protein [Weissella confusa]MBJ7637614.1 hypothetical protein [Weissella confusa]MBJ7698569.1 hypothetical protein [Weissella confusa]MBS7550833.1 hypothetical protein [Weissella confusa]